MYHFCTYFDSNYLLRGITLYRSLVEHCETPFRFYVLCLDENAFNALTKLDEENIVPIELKNVEQWDNELLAAKGNRSRIEYYFTMSPILPLFVLEHFEVDLVIYLDADLMFFSSPEPIYEELGERSIFVTEHHFSEKLKDSIKYGRFNVQCQAFRNDKVGLKCLHRWREQCLAWCYDHLEDGKFADQKYLDEWPELYGDSLVISQHPGIGVAPWNVGGVTLRKSRYSFAAKNKPVVFYHFHGFREVAFCKVFAKTLYPYHVEVTSAINELYRCYVYGLRDAEEFLTGCVESQRRETGKALRHSHKQIRILIASLRRGDILFVQ